MRQECYWIRDIFYRSFEASLFREIFNQITNFEKTPDKGEIELWSLTVEDGLTPK